MKVICRAYDQLATRANLAQWGLSSNGKCILCEKPGTLAHIMSGCSIALSSGRYMWHHNRVLKWLVDMIDLAWNKAAASLSPHHKMVSFIKEGDKPSFRTKMMWHWLVLNRVKVWKIAAVIKGGKQYQRIISKYHQHSNIMVWLDSDCDNHHRAHHAI